MTPATSIINRPMAPRGNKGMKLLTVYLDPETMRKFKMLCVSENKPMTKVVQEFVKKIVKEKAA